MAERRNDYIKNLRIIFEELPEKAKDLCFYYFYKKCIFDSSIFEFSNECKSQIEKIFFVAFRIVENLRINEMQDICFGFHVIPQFAIVCDKHIYYADFMIIFENFTDPNNGYSLIIECDGHDFHEKTKEQVKRDNERTYALKKHGEDILRFSGSQIYNDPIKCANDVFDYILTKAKEV